MSDAMTTLEKLRTWKAKGLSVEVEMCGPSEARMPFGSDDARKLLALVEACIRYKDCKRPYQILDALYDIGVHR